MINGTEKSLTAHESATDAANVNLHFVGEADNGGLVCDKLLTRCQLLLHNRAVCPHKCSSTSRTTSPNRLNNEGYPTAAGSSA